VAFANTLARARFEVLVPDLVHMRALQVTGLDAIPIADSAAYLDERGDGWPVGIAAVSFAVGPGVKALLEPEARNRVDFLLGIGGYYDLDALITYITTGYFRADAGSPWSYRQPSDYGKWVFLLSNAARIEDEADQKILFEIANRKLADPGADVEDMVQGLGPEGLAVYALLTNGDPDRVPSLIGALPSDIRFEMQFLDMDRFDLSGLDVDFILIHGSYDPVIPASESVALARAVDPGRARVYLIDSLDHAHPQPPSLGDGLRMLRAVYAILVQRDG
jgi:pimeloyl-ACP methyl ester carboxylesterase